MYFYELGGMMTMMMGLLLVFDADDFVSLKVYSCTLRKE